MPTKKIRDVLDAIQVKHSDLVVKLDLVIRLISSHFSLVLSEAEEQFDELDITVLKLLLEMRGLPVSGRKGLLVTRLAFGGMMDDEEHSAVMRHMIRRWHPERADEIQKMLITARQEQREAMRRSLRELKSYADEAAVIASHMDRPCKICGILFQVGDDIAWHEDGDVHCECLSGRPGKSRVRKMNRRDDDEDADESGKGSAAGPGRKAANSGAKSSRSGAGYKVNHVSGRGSSSTQGGRRRGCIPAGFTRQVGSGQQSNLSFGALNHYDSSMTVWEWVGSTTTIVQRLPIQ